MLRHPNSLLFLISLILSQLYVQHLPFITFLLYKFLRLFPSIEFAGDIALQISCGEPSHYKTAYHHAPVLQSTDIGQPLEHIVGDAAMDAHLCGYVDLHPE